MRKTSILILSFLLVISISAVASMFDDVDKDLRKTYPILKVELEGHMESKSSGSSDHKSGAKGRAEASSDEIKKSFASSAS